VRRLSASIVLAVSFGLSAATAAADPWHPHYYGYFGGCGYESAIVVYDLSRAGGARRYAAQERLLGQQIAAQQLMVRQAGIRNSMQSAGEQRMQGIVDQQQADRQWWLQAQQEQIAERKARAAQLELVRAAADANSSTTGASQLFQWPAVLRDQRFAEHRSRIEAPYRRGSKLPSVPTAKDYQDTIEATVQIRATLKSMAADITAQDYLDATAFLDYVAAEARMHIKDSAPRRW
jgi:hypothetical protein